MDTYVHISMNHPDWLGGEFLLPRDSLYILAKADFMTLVCPEGILIQNHGDFKDIFTCFLRFGEGQGEITLLLRPHCQDGTVLPYLDSIFHQPI